MRNSKNGVKKALMLLLVVTIIVSGLLVSRNLILKTVLENTIYNMSGMKLTASSIDIGLLRPYLKVDYLILFNPAGFHDKIMFEIPELYVEYDVSSFFENKIHIKEMDLHVKLLNFIKDEDGKINLGYLNIVNPAAQEKGSDPFYEKGPRPLKPRIDIRIDKLRLRGGRVIYKDYTQKPDPKVTEFNAIIDESYEDITDIDAVGKLIVSDYLAKTGALQIAGIDLGSLKIVAETTKDVLQEVINAPFGKSQSR